MSNHTFLVLFALAAYLFSAIFAVAGMVLRSRVRRLFQSALRTKGSIISLERSVSMSSEMVYPVVFPHFRFTDLQGVERSVRSSVGVQPETYTVGDAVEVTYNSASPQEAVIDPKTIRRMARIAIFASVFTAIVATGIFVVVWFGFA